MEKRTHNPKSNNPEKKEEPRWLIFLVGAAAGAMIAMMIAFQCVVETHGKAYAESFEAVSFDAVSDISTEEVPNDQGELERLVEGEGLEELQESVQAVPDDAGWEDPDLEYEPWVQPYGYYAGGYTEAYASGEGDGGLRYDGVQYGDDGTRYTWYSENVLPGGGLDIPGRGVDENGFVTDGDGNICVASSDYPMGTELDTPYGTAVVYDTGCPSGVVDVYTSW